MPSAHAMAHDVLGTFLRFGLLLQVGGGGADIGDDLVVGRDI